MKSISYNDIAHIVSEFLTIWDDRQEYIGTLLTGSFASNTADEGSDIDLRILYEDGCDLYEMGECWVEGKCVSFLAMSLSEYLEIFKDEITNQTSKFEIRRFLVGKVLTDKTGQLQELKRLAEEMAKEPFVAMQPIEILKEKLELSRKYKVLLEMPEKDLFYPMAYYDFLQVILQSYAKYTKADIPAFIKKYSRYFESETYRNANKFTAFPDEEFSRHYQEAAKTLDRKVLANLYQYVIYEMEGLPDTNFLARFYTQEESANMYLFE